MTHANTLIATERLPEVTGRGYDSTRELQEAVLGLLAKQLDMRSCLLARTTREGGRHEVLAAYNLPGGCDIVAGDVFELRQTF